MIHWYSNRILKRIIAESDTGRGEKIRRDDERMLRIGIKVIPKTSPCGEILSPPPRPVFVKNDEIRKIGRQNPPKKIV